MKTVVAILTHSRNQFGNTSKCNICESIFHWAKDCPDAHRSQNEDKRVYQTRSTTLEASDSRNQAKVAQEADIWFQSPNLDKVEMKVFVGKTLSCGMHDSGCT